MFSGTIVKTILKLEKTGENFKSILHIVKIADILNLG